MIRRRRRSADEPSRSWTGRRCSSEQRRETAGAVRPHARTRILTWAHGEREIGRAAPREGRRMMLNRSIRARLELSGFNHEGTKTQTLRAFVSSWFAAVDYRQRRK